MSRFTAWLGNQRRMTRLLRPRAQLMLPLYLVGVTAVFAGLLGFMTHAAYARVGEAIVASVPQGLAEIVLAQTRDFLVMTTAIAVAYLFAVAVVCVGYLHRLVGPTVALERQLSAMERGEYTQRVGLRSSDTVFEPLAQHLNTLAERLERQSAPQPTRSP